MRKLLVLMGLVFALSGCATYQAVTSSPLMEGAIRVSVGRVLEANPAWVAPTYKFTSAALDVAEGQGIISVGDIDTLFLQSIKGSMTPEEMDLAVGVFESIKLAIIEDLNRRGITSPEGKKLYTIQALTWINQSAAIRLK